MDYHLEGTVVLNDKPEHTNLYKWSLNEVGEPSLKFKTDQIPWTWSLYFLLSDIELHAVFKLDPWGAEDEAAAKITARDFIRANLRPGSRLGPDLVHFSMFGTNRRIEDITLTVRPAVDGVEHCRAWGVVSYTTDHDFRDVTTDDSLGFELYLSPEHFAQLANRVAARAVGGGCLRVDSVSGFYSDWSPSISTYHVKVLTDESTHKVEIPEGCKFIPPRLETVRAFDLSVWSDAIRPTAKVGASTDDDERPLDQWPEETAKPAQVNLFPVLKSLRLAVWVIAGLLVLVALK